MVHNRIFPYICWRMKSLSRIRFVPFGSGSMTRSASSSPSSLDGSRVNVYEGIFVRNLKYLKRFSLLSSVLCATAVPFMVYSSPAQIAVAGKIAITGTAFVTTSSSTTMIQYITRPYVISIDELLVGEKKDIDEIDGEESRGGNVDSDEKDRKFVATTLSLLGFPRQLEFKLADVERHKGIHPFATHMIKDTRVFLFSQNITDDELKAKLS